MADTWLALLVKVAGTALTVVAASFIAERSGPFWGGVVASLPVVAGPSYLILSMQMDSAFIARSALSSFSALSSIALFLLILVRALPHLAAPAAFAASIGGWFCVSILLFEFPPTLAAAIMINVLIFAVGFYSTRRAWNTDTALRNLPRRWFDLPLRAVLIGLFVTGVVTASAAIGQIATGIATMFPISLVSLAAIVRARLGGEIAAATMASALRAIVGLGAALLVLHLTAEAWGMRVALIAGLSASLAWSAAMIAWRTQRPRVVGRDSRRHSINDDFPE
jgi:hypothetical protein